MIGVLTRSLFALFLLGSLPGRSGFAAAPQAELSPAPPSALATNKSQGFRGDGSGRFPDARPPLEWSAHRNILWSTQIGPNRYSSPVLSRGRLFLVADPNMLFCVEADSGRILWKKTNDFSDLPDAAKAREPRGDAGNTTPTPVTDGEFVYAVFGTGIVACYDRNGERRWIKLFSPNPPPEYGRSSSPILAGGRLLVTLSNLIALDPKTGQTLWTNKEVLEQYGTPLAANLGGTDVAILPSGQIVGLSDGKLLATDLGGLRYASPIVHEGTLFLIQAGSAALQFPEAIKGQWQAKQVWDQELQGQFFASAVWDKGLIYAVSNEGYYYVLSAIDGKIVASHELDLPAAGGKPGTPAVNLYPSLCIAGNYLMLFDDRGETRVLELGAQYKELKRNRLPSGHGSTPVFDGHRLYLRGDQRLYCIGEEAPRAPTSNKP